MAKPAEPPLGPIYTKQRGRGPVRRALSIFGPGVITGAADDDPSGIVTYSIAGAQLGTSILWVALLTWPLMCAVQMMCARIAMVTGSGLAASLKKKVPRPVLALMGLALFITNAINIGADLSGMADVTHLLTGIDLRIWVVIFGLAMIVATVRFKYAAIARILKWLALFLFAYVISAFLVHPDWHQVLVHTFIPTLPASHAEWATLTAILGTTISPYLFFWQASQEIEEEKALGRVTRASRRNATVQEIIERKIDVGMGGFFSNLIMFFIILTTAVTLHQHGLTHVQTSHDVIEALQPLAGRFATLLFAIGMIGVGFLAIPTLAGSAAYVFTETFGFRQGLDESVRRARAFYGILTLAIFLGIGLSFTPIKPVNALYWSAVINGVLAPFLLVAILSVACDRKTMLGQPSSILGRTMVIITTVGMFAAAIALFVL